MDSGRLLARPGGPCPLQGSVFCPGGRYRVRERHRPERARSPRGTALHKLLRGSRHGPRPARGRAPAWLDTARPRGLGRGRAAPDRRPRHRGDLAGRRLDAATGTRRERREPRLPRSADAAARCRCAPTSRCRSTRARAEARSRCARSPRAPTSSARTHLEVLSVAGRLLTYEWESVKWRADLRRLSERLRDPERTDAAHGPPQPGGVRGGGRARVAARLARHARDVRAGLPRVEPAEGRRSATVPRWRS